MSNETPSRLLPPTTPAEGNHSPPSSVRSQVRSHSPPSSARSQVRPLPLPLQTPGTIQSRVGGYDYAEDETHLVIDRLSKSHCNLRDIVEAAQEEDPEAFAKALHDVEAEQRTNGQNRWSTLPVSTLALELSTSLQKGLSDESVLELRELHGQNVLTQEAEEPWWRMFLMQFASPVVILLLVAAIVSLGFQEWVEGIAIFVIVLLNACLATYMEKSAGDALAKLASLAAPKCTVIRNGTESIIDAQAIVPGDLVILKTGDSIPADMRCVDVTELMCNEAILTGESEDVRKGLLAKDTSTPFATNMCFASTSVTNGKGRGIVVFTGMNTQVGRIAEQLKKASKGSKLTPLQRGLNKLGGIIGAFAVCVLIVVVLVAVLTNYRDPTHPDTDPILQIVLVAVSFAVSSIPEGLPMVVTICLSLGCRDMVKRFAQVRKLPAVETLGSCTVVCSDKVGVVIRGHEGGRKGGRKGGRE
eukprot:GHVU01199715.1.p1 GENE.GHVU01199715.1~~GHVU01199715.1.p1  ORF type:complete len:472 (+),score=82.12 GHVU01199715.1:2255-3670(+)